jgi:nicotinamidase/pyrazinamidase
MSNALVIIDVQNAFLEKGEIQVCENVNSILRIIKDLQCNPFFNNIIVTQHVYPTKKYLDRNTLVTGTFGSELHEVIDKNKINLLVIKQTYSAFDSDNTLLDYLNRNNIKKLYLCGLAYDYCVGDTAISASKNGFNVTVIKNATKSYSKETEINMNVMLLDYNVNIVNMF